MVSILAPLSFDFASLHRAYAEGLSPAEVADLSLTRLMELRDPGIYIAMRDQAAILEDCRALGAFDLAAKPLWGLPFAVKDNVDVAGLATTVACPQFAYMPKQSAPAVELLQKAGAILLGKTNLDQFATGLAGVRTSYPVPRNAIDPSLVPGGSSSGSAVAVAQGLVSFALGTDTAGSGRVPAALNNIVGLKPSLGLISPRGVFPACRSLDTISIFALTVDDAFKALECCAHYDAAEPYSRAMPLLRPFVPPVLRLGIPNAKSRQFFGDAVAEAAFDAALANEAFAGAERVEIDFAPFFDVAALLYNGPFVAERYAAIRAFIEAQPQALYPVTRQIIEGARAFSAADAFAGLYRLAELKRVALPVWDNIDCLVVPSMPGVVTLEEIAADPIGPNACLGTYTNFVNLLDLSALAVPGPFRSDGRPAGITLIAPAGQDALLAGVGRVFHAHANLSMGASGIAVPALAEEGDALPPDWIELVVVGAHMQGLALNTELVASGGTFRREAQTAASYRLFVVPETEPARPGLIRAAKGEGQAIAVEVWALPPAGFGRFVAAIPSPLCIGSVELADGSVLKGFLCEPEALHGAQDISHLGGWRAFQV